MRYTLSLLTVLILSFNSFSQNKIPKDTVIKGIKTGQGVTKMDTTNIATIPNDMPIASLKDFQTVFSYIALRYSETNKAMILEAFQMVINEAQKPKAKKP